MCLPTSLFIQIFQSFSNYHLCCRVFYHSHTFVLSASLTIQAILEIEKRRIDSSCTIFHTSAISVLLPLGQISLLLLCVRIIAIDFILVLPLNLLPLFQNTHSCDLTKDHQFNAFMLFPSTFLEYLTFTFSSVCYFPCSQSTSLFGIYFISSLRLFMHFSWVSIIFYVLNIFY